MKSFLFIVSIPHERGIVHYDTQTMLMLLPEGYRVIDRKPEMTVHPKEILFCWKCEEIADQDRVNTTAGQLLENQEVTITEIPRYQDQISSPNF